MVPALCMDLLYLAATWRLQSGHCWWVLQVNSKTSLPVFEIAHFLVLHLRRRQVELCLVACTSVCVQWPWIDCKRLLQSQEITFRLALLADFATRTAVCPCATRQNAWCDNMIDNLDRSLCLPDNESGVEFIRTIFLFMKKSSDAGLDVYGVE